MENLKNQKIVIIGASSGIGKALTQLVVQQGAVAVMVSRSIEKLEEARKNLPIEQTELFSMNMLDEKSVNEVFEEIGYFDHLVVTAVAEENKLRTSLRNATTDIAEKSLQKFWGAFYTCKTALDYISKTGSITLTSSIAIFRPSSGGDMSLLTAGHGAVTSFARALAVEIAPIRVNVIAPGVVDTAVWDDKQRENLVKWANDKLLVKHLGNANELAMAYISLMSNNYITGTLLKVDGGLTLI
jgi:NAD(P)-dependent dehydrogenase (short-subunit alcohol dehydrogenase family)